MVQYCRTAFWICLLHIFTGTLAQEAFNDSPKGGQIKDFTGSRNDQQTSSGLLSQNFDPSNSNDPFALQRDSDFSNNLDDDQQLTDQNFPQDQNQDPNFPVVEPGLGLSQASGPTTRPSATVGGNGFFILDASLLQQQSSVGPGIVIENSSATTHDTLDSINSAISNSNPIFNPLKNREQSPSIPHAFLPSNTSVNTDEGPYNLENQEPSTYDPAPIFAINTIIPGAENEHNGHLNTLTSQSQGLEANSPTGSSVRVASEARTTQGPFIPPFSEQPVGAKLLNNANNLDENDISTNQNLAVGSDGLLLNPNLAVNPILIAENNGTRSFPSSPPSSTTQGVPLFPLNLAGLNEPRDDSNPPLLSNSASNQTDQSAHEDLESPLFATHLPPSNSEVVVSSKSPQTEDHTENPFGAEAGITNQDIFTDKVGDNFADPDPIIPVSIQSEGGAPASTEPPASEGAGGFFPVVLPTVVPIRIFTTTSFSGDVEGNEVFLAGRAPQNATNDLSPVGVDGAPILDSGSLGSEFENEDSLLPSSTVTLSPVFNVEFQGSNGSSVNQGFGQTTPSDLQQPGETTGSIFDSQPSASQLSSTSGLGVFISESPSNGESISTTLPISTTTNPPIFVTDGINDSLGGNSDSLSSSLTSGSPLSFNINGVSQIGLGGASPTSALPIVEQSPPSLEGFENVDVGGSSAGNLLISSTSEMPAFVQASSSGAPFASQVPIIAGSNPSEITPFSTTQAVSAVVDVDLTDTPVAEPEPEPEPSITSNSSDGSSPEPDPEPISGVINQESSTPAGIQNPGVDLAGSTEPPVPEPPPSLETTPGIPSPGLQTGSVPPASPPAPINVDPSSSASPDSTLTSVSDAEIGVTDLSGRFQQFTSTSEPFDSETELIDSQSSIVPSFTVQGSSGFPEGASENPSTIIPTTDDVSAPSTENAGGIIGGGSVDQSSVSSVFVSIAQANPSSEAPESSFSPGEPASTSEPSPEPEPSSQSEPPSLSSVVASSEPPATSVDPQSVSTIDLETDQPIVSSTFAPVPESTSFEPGSTGNVPEIGSSTIFVAPAITTAASNGIFSSPAPTSDDSTAEPIPTTPISVAPINVSQTVDPNAIPDAATSADPQFVPTDAPLPASNVATNYQFKIVNGADWDDAMKSADSWQFTKLKRELESPVNEIFEKILGDRFTSHKITFLTKGSVVVHGTLNSREQLDQQKVVGEFFKTVEANGDKIGKYGIEKRSIVIGVGDVEGISEPRSSNPTGNGRIPDWAVGVIAAIVVLVLVLIVISLIMFGIKQRNQSRMNIEKQEYMEDAYTANGSVTGRSWRSDPQAQMAVGGYPPQIYEMKEPLGPPMVLQPQPQPVVAIQNGGGYNPHQNYGYNYGGPPPQGMYPQQNADDVALATYARAMKSYYHGY